MIAVAGVLHEHPDLLRADIQKGRQLVRNGVKILPGQAELIGVDADVFHIGAHGQHTHVPVIDGAPCRSHFANAGLIVGGQLAEGIVLYDLQTHQPPEQRDKHRHPEQRHEHCGSFQHRPVGISRNLRFWKGTFQWLGLLSWNLPYYYMPWNVPDIHGVWAPRMWRMKKSSGCGRTIPSFSAVSAR